MKKLLVALGLITALFSSSVLASKGRDKGKDDTLNLASGQITACVHKKKGKMRMVESPDQCKKKEYALSWNIQGVQGETGDTGAQGAPGIQGEMGLQGLTGDTGEQGIAGPAGDTYLPELPEKNTGTSRLVYNSETDTLSWEQESQTCTDVVAIIETQAHVSRYTHCTDLAKLYLHQTNGVTVVSLPHLEKVHGYVYFHQNEDLKTVFLPNLEGVKDYVYFSGNDALVSVDLSNLRVVGDNDEGHGGYVYFEGNDALVSIDLSSLKYVFLDEDGNQGYIYLSGNDALESTNIGEYQSISRIIPQ